MKNRKIVIPLFIILIISFVAMIFFYFYKKHNDKIKLQEEQKLNEKLIKEKIDLINKNYGIYGCRLYMYKRYGRGFNSI